MIKKLFMAILCSILIFGSTRAENPNVQVGPQNQGFSNADVHNSSGITYTMKIINKIYRNGKIYNNDKKPGEHDSYCICRYPVFSGTKSAVYINKTLDSRIALLLEHTDKKSGKSIEVLSSDILKQTNDMAKENGITEAPYYVNLLSSVLLNHSGVLTVSIVREEYLGGMHPTNGTDYFVFDTLSGKRLKLNDIFVTGFESRLNKLIDVRFRKMKGLSNIDRLDGEKGRLNENAIHFNQNFVLTDKGISFSYNPTEIASYGEGEIKLDFSYNEMKNILKHEYNL